jgi:hypothetical protein
MCLVRGAQLIVCSLTCARSRRQPRNSELSKPGGSPMEKLTIGVMAAKEKHHLDTKEMERTSKPRRLIPYEYSGNQDMSSIYPEGASRLIAANTVRSFEMKAMRISDKVDYEHRVDVVVQSRNLKAE